MQIFVKNVINLAETLLCVSDTSYCNIYYDVS